jgi:glycosyltransferase involved in cell wall biosynthesis
MNFNPKVAVIIRAHLQAEFLFEALDSINSQEYDGEIDVFLILDQVMDDVRNNVLKNEYKFSLTMLENNYGDIASGMNLAIDKTNANYIAVLDSDDRMNKNRISEQLKYLVDNGFSAIGSHLTLISESGLSMGKQEMPKGSDVERLLGERSTIAHPSSMYVRRDVVAIGRYRSFYAYAEDYDLFLRLSERYKIGNIDQYLTDYRIHPGQITKSKLKRHVWAVLAVKESLGLRLLGLPELHESFQNILTWRKLGEKKMKRRIRFQVLYSKSVISKSSSVLKIENLKHIVFLLILNPNFFIKAFCNRFRIR